MNGHIFDANTLRNLGLVGQFSILPDVCQGTLYRSGIVKDELDRGAPAFARAYGPELLKGSPRRSTQMLRFSSLNSALASIGVRDVRLTLNATHQEAFQFFACCMENEAMDPGEAESFALAATRGWTIYTDDRAAYKAIERFNAGDFRCPPYGRDLALHRPVAVHSTAWLLIEAIRLNALPSATAEGAFLEMRDVWDRHPQQTLAQLQQRGASAYW